jgi:hypothetical protein
MELKCRNAAVIAAQDASPTCFGDKDSLDAAPAIGDLLLAAELAAVRAPRVEPKADEPMFGAGAVG